MYNVFIIDGIRFYLNLNLLLLNKRRRNGIFYGLILNLKSLCYLVSEVLVLRKYYKIFI